MRLCARHPRYRQYDQVNRIRHQRGSRRPPLHFAVADGPALGPLLPPLPLLSSLRSGRGRTVDAALADQEQAFLPSRAGGFHSLVVCADAERLPSGKQLALVGLSGIADSPVQQKLSVGILSRYRQLTEVLKPIR